MAKLKIPERYRPALKFLAEMDDATFGVISSALGGPKNASPDQKLDKRLPSSISEKASGRYNEGEIDGLLRALRTLSVIRSSSEVGAAEFVTDVTDAFSEVSGSNLKEPNKGRFAERLRGLLDAAPFVLEGKATSLIISDERVYCKSRAITDLRPIFSDDIEDGPLAMIIVHSLKLTFHQGREKHQVFHLAMDSNDIAELRKVLDRAEAKAKSLRDRIPQYPYWE